MSMPTPPDDRYASSPPAEYRGGQNKQPEDKGKPFDKLAEQAILASILSVPESFDEIAQIVSAADFFEPANQIIFDTVVELRDAGRPFDPITLNAELLVNGLANNVGGISYLVQILSPDNLSSYSSDPLSYALVVRDLARRRELMDISITINEAALLGSGLTADQAAESAEASLMEAIHKSESSTVLSASELFDGTIEEIRAAGELPEGVVRGIPTGFPLLDSMTTGFHPSQVTLIGARPAVGKSAIALDFARAAAYLAGKSVLFFSLEMTNQELMLRLLSAEARVAQQDIKKGSLSQEDWMNIEKVRDRIKNGSLFFDTTAEVGLSHIRSRALRQKMSPAGLDLIIIDYLQLMQVPPGNKSATRENQVSALSRGIKLLAKQMEVPILILSQLNRSSESRVDKKPAMSDLRESGAIEQDMDVILLLHRPEQSDPNLRPGEADLIIAKNRHGPTNTVPLTPMLQFSKFVPGEGVIARDNSVYEETDENGEIVYAAPTEEDETPW